MPKYRFYSSLCNVSTVSVRLVWSVSLKKQKYTTYRYSYHSISLITRFWRCNFKPSSFVLLEEILAYLKLVSALVPDGVVVDVIERFGWMAMTTNKCWKKNTLQKHPIHSFASNLSPQWSRRTFWRQSFSLNEYVCLRFCMSVSSNKKKS